MARAKRPVTIAGIEFDALISEEHGYEAMNEVFTPVYECQYITKE